MKRLIVYNALLLALATLLILPMSCKDNADSKLTMALDSLFAGFSDNQPGGSFLILRGEEELYSASFGVADMQTGEPFTRETISNIGSISKTFVAYGILILEKQGRLSVDDSIAKYFPDFGNNDIAAKVKIIHLLTHTSGLPDSRNVSNNREFFLTANDEENFAPLKATDSLEFEPGTAFKYSNPSYNALALIIEQVSGMPWRDFIRQQIFEPAGIPESRITDGAYPDKDVAHGYRLVNNVYEEYDFGEYPTFNAAGNGGVWCSVDGLLKYVRAMENCSFLDCETMAKSKRVWPFPDWNSAEHSQRGISWVIHNEPDTTKSLCIEHSGSQGGFRAHLLMYPDEQITIIWLTNNSQTYTEQIQEVLGRYGYVR